MEVVSTLKVDRIDRSKAVPVSNKGTSGVLHWQALFADPTDEGGLTVTWFDPGGRTKPHVHSVPQVINVLEGTGIVAVEDERVTVKPGDFILVPPGAWHWHGATPTQSMCHIASRDRARTEWKPGLRDWEDYS
jgi:quercetin dioxygenase-like cupin family protein